MSYKTTFITSATLLLLATSVYAAALGFKLGPFQLELGGGPNRPFVVPAPDPICRAIKEHKLVEVTFETDEKINDNEIRIITKKVTLEPYLLGKNKEDQLILRGNILSDHILKEVTVREFTDGQKPSEKRKWSNYLRFWSDQREVDVDTLNLRRINDIRVVEDSSFKGPADLKAIFKEDVAEVICVVDAS